MSRVLAGGGGAFLLWLLLTGSPGARRNHRRGAGVALATVLIAAPRLALLEDI